MVERISSSYPSALAAVVQPRQNLTIMSALPAHRATLTHYLAARVRLAPSIPDHLDRARPSMPSPARPCVLACRPATGAIVPRRQIAVAALGRLRSGLRRPRRSYSCSSPARVSRLCDSRSVNRGQSVIRLSASCLRPSVCDERVLLFVRRSEEHTSELQSRP